MKTWKIEMLVVAVLLLTVNICTHKFYSIEILASIAVLLTFGHAQIAARLAEKEAKRTVVEVDCHGMMWLYFFGKEMFWLLYFFLNHSYSALMGVFIFIFYPFWRLIYRNFK